MKTKKLLATLFAVVTAVLMLTGLALTASAALNDPNNVKEVGLTLPEPKAGQTVDLSNSSVTCAHSMEYKVVSVRWYLYGQDDSIYNCLGTGSNDKYFHAGQAYTVKVSLQVKGDREWNSESIGGMRIYEMSATVNGQAAVIQSHEVNPEDTKLITVSYTFSGGLPKTEIVPYVSVANPVAGKTKDEIPVLSTNSRHMYLAPWGEDCNWFVYGNGQWQPMDTDDKFVAGKDYRLIAKFVPNSDYIFSQSGTHTVGDSKYIYGYVNGRQLSMKLTKYGDQYLYDNGVTFTYDFVSCDAQSISSVSFSGIPAPVVGQNPQYAVTMGAATYSLVTDEAVNGGAEYGFVNGISWSTGVGHLTSTSVFEAGAYYTASFFIKSDDVHCFADTVSGNADVGYVSVEPVIGDSTLAFVTVEFAPCGGGVMNTLNVGGFREPIHGASPDTNLLCGQGYEKHGELKWFEVNDSGERAMEPGDSFVFGNRYKVVMVLKATGGFTLATRDKLIVYVNGKAAEQLSGFEATSESEYVVAAKYFDCGKASVEQVSVTLEAPVEGNKPAKQITLGSNSYSVAIFEISDHETDKTLEGEDVYVGLRNYSVLVIVTANNGYQFINDVEASVNGQYANVVFVDSNELVFSTILMAEELPYYNVSFVDDIGSSVATGLITKAGIITLPEYEMIIPAGYKFVGWTLDGGTTVLVGEYLVSGHTEFLAVLVEENVHKHVYDNKYIDDGNGMHHQMCIADDCDDREGSKINQGMHQYENSHPCALECIICGHVRSSDVGFGYHSYKFNCSEVCPTCGMKREVTHTPGAEATCTESQKCTVCSKVLVDALGHTAGEAANCGHAQTCTVCGIELAPIQGEHVPGSAATCTEAQKCTVCSAELAPAKGHTAGVEWMQNEEAHWHVCAACNGECERAEHADEDGDEICDVCAYDFSVPFPGWAIALIAVGGGLVLGTCGFAIFWFVIKKKKLSDLRAVFKK